MKKTLLALVPALALLTSCAGENAQLAADEARVTVCGQGIADGDSVVLLAVSAGMITPLDTAVADDAGAVLQTKVGYPGSLLFILKIQGGEFSDDGYPVILEPTKAITMTLPETEKDDVKFKNSKDSELWYECQRKGETIVDELETYIMDLRDPGTDPARRAIAEQKVDSAQEAMLQFYANKIIDNAPSAFSDIMLGSCADALDDATIANVLEKVSAYSDKMPNYFIVKAQFDAKAKTAEGAKFIDFTMTSIDGKQVTLSDVVKANKLTLVDFWASWCGPCRAEMPSVVKAYNQFGNKGLAIVGVSLDADVNKWTQAVNDLGMKWIQLSDLKAWQNEAARLYSVEAIPSCFLINQDGVIVAKNLRGEELVDRIAKLLE